MTSTTPRATFVAAALLVASAAQAQQDNTVRIDEHWRAYLGCWATSSSATTSGPMVCVVPTRAAQTVDFVTVVGDSIVSTVPVTASGAKVEVTRDGCTGWESGRWSMDERRLYTHAQYTCPGGTTQQLDGMITMRSEHEFSRIEGLKTRGGMRTRVVRFELQLDSTIYPSAVRSRLASANLLPYLAARMEASAEVSSADVVDATKELDAALVETWLGDRGQPFRIDANDLRALKSSRVPENVIDMVVALANPASFTLAQNGAPEARVADPFRTRRGGAGVTPGAVGVLDPNQCSAGYTYLSSRCDAYFGWGDAYFPWFGYPIYRGFGGYSYQYGPFGPIYGNSWYGGGIGGGGYVIVPVTPKDPEPPGRVINGSGYSQGGASGGSRAEPRSPNVGGSNYGGGTSASVNSGASGGGASSAPASTGGGEQRTAKPRP